MTQATILYVDDEAMALKYFDRLISPHFTVLTALSVSEGIEILKAEGQSISVLISDQRMPGANGNELLSYARHNYPHIVRLLTTAYSELGDAILAINAGEIYRYITKPWDADMLRTEVRLAYEVAALRSEREDLLRAKIQVQQAQLLANRVNNLALICGSAGHANDQAEPVQHALQHYLTLAKKLGPISLSVDWRKLHYTDWMQKEVRRHTQIQAHLTHWLKRWEGQPVTADTLRLALGGRDCSKEDVTLLLAQDSTEPTAESVATLAWFIAVYLKREQTIQDSLDAQSGQLSLLAAPSNNAPYSPLRNDWLAGAMEDL